MLTRWLSADGRSRVAWLKLFGGDVWRCFLEDESLVDVTLFLILRHALSLNRRYFGVLEVLPVLGAPVGIKSLIFFFVRSGRLIVSVGIGLGLFAIVGVEVGVGGESPESFCYVLILGNVVDLHANSNYRICF